MFIDFDEYIRYLSDKRMTPNQFVLCWMIHNRDIKNINKYIERVGKFKREDMKFLLDNEFLLSTNPDDPDFDNVFTTNKFSDEVFIDGEAALQELVRIYPPYIVIDRRKYLTNACDLDALSLYYDKKIIKGNKLKHNEILEKSKKVIEKMRTGEIAVVKIDKFIKGQLWSLSDNEGFEDRDTFRKL